MLDYTVVLQVKYPKGDLITCGHLHKVLAEAQACWDNWMGHLKSGKAGSLGAAKKPFDLEIKMVELFNTEGDMDQITIVEALVKEE